MLLDPQSLKVRKESEAKAPDSKETLKFRRKLGKL